MTDPAIIDLATRILTPGQLQVWTLGLEYPEGARFRPLAHRLGLARTTVVDRWDRAHDRLAEHGVLVDQRGNYYLQETA